jgi:hypothetical protein
MNSRLRGNNHTKSACADSAAGGRAASRAPARPHPPHSTCGTSLRMPKRTAVFGTGPRRRTLRFSSGEFIRWCGLGDRPGVGVPSRYGRLGDLSGCDASRVLRRTRQDRRLVSQVRHPRARTPDHPARGPAPPPRATRRAPHSAGDADGGGPWWDETWRAGASGGGCGTSGLAEADQGLCGAAARGGGTASAVWALLPGGGGGT